MKVTRYDAGRLGRATRTPHGGVRIPATLTRTGIYEYREPDGSMRREYRPADEVFRADSLRQLDGAPVTVDRHEMVSPGNWRSLAVGHVGSVRRDGEVVTADLDINDSATLERIDAGELQEISAGYLVSYDPTPGEYNGQRYDGVQRDIQYNHVVLLPRGAGRCGPTCRLRTDSNESETMTETDPLKKMLEDFDHADAEARADCACDAEREDSDDETDPDLAEARMLTRHRNAWKNPKPTPETPTRSDAIEDDSEDSDLAELQMIERTQNAWRK